MGDDLVKGGVSIGSGYLASVTASSFGYPLEDIENDVLEMAAEEATREVINQVETKSYAYSPEMICQDIGLCPA